jgi:hypothetical protein
MSLLMAEKDQPMFRDFLGLSHMDEVKQAEFPSSDALQGFHSHPSLKVEVDPETFATRASSGTIGQVETRNSPVFVSPPFGLAPATTSAEPGVTTLFASHTYSLLTPLHSPRSMSFLSFEFMHVFGLVGTQSCVHVRDLKEFHV